MSSSDAAEQKYFTGKVLMGVDTPGPDQMSLQEMEGKKRLSWDDSAGDELMRRVRARAQAMAKDLLMQAQAEAEQIKADAHDQGYQEGLQQAQAELDQAVTSISQQFGATLTSLQSQGRTLFSQQRQEIVGLIKLAVNKLIGQAMDQDREAVSGRLLEEALERIDSRRELTVRCSPEDLELMDELLRQAQQNHPDLKNWKIRADQAVRGGGVVLDSGVGMVDNTLDARMQSVSFVFDQLTASAKSVEPKPEPPQPKPEPPAQPEQAQPAQQQPAQPTPKPKPAKKTKPAQKPKGQGHA
jgi:flagellar assembly protein FliH